MPAIPAYDDERGWVAVDGLIDEERAAELATRCSRLADGLDAPRSGDKPHGGTRRLTDLDDRLPDTLDLVDRLAPVVDQILPGGWVVSEIAYRCPGPGRGAQRLHADDVPRLDDGPHRCATAIVALVGFTTTNGATAVVPGSHRRPDLQRHSGTLEGHPEAVALTGPAGTAFVFTGHLLHGGTANRSAEERPAIQLSFRSRDAASGPHR